MWRERVERNFEEHWNAERDEVRRLRRSPAGVRVSVEEGCLLVTREGDPEDHVVSPGQSLLVAGPGLAVAWALEPSRVVLAPARAAADDQAGPGLAA